ncbi:MAG: VOC family protein, partial [Actinomycetota bacterium]
MRHGEHHYFVLHTTDLAATSRYFSELLGWEVVDGEIRNVANFGAITESHERSWWVHVDDCDAAAAKVVELGGEVRQITDERSGRNAVCLDDQGNPFHMGTLITEFQDHPHPPPLPEGELGYATFSVGDTGRAVDFYGALFGWEFTPPGEAGVREEYRHCTNGALPFGFRSDGDDSPHLYFRITDVEAARARVVELGGSAPAVDVSESGRSLINGRDPVGVRFDLWEPA